MKYIIRNAVKCNLCGETIESLHRHDFKFCKCGNIAVDGGFDYIRRVGGDKGSFTELSVKEDPDVFRDKRLKERQKQNTSWNKD